MDEEDGAAVESRLDQAAQLVTVVWGFNGWQWSCLEASWGRQTANDILHNTNYANSLGREKARLEFWMHGRSVKVIAKRLKRSERSVHDWLTGKRKIPWWVPEILRLQHYEYQDRLRQMGFKQ
ncbi:hypothetical protein [Herbaspirillum seropedicae]|uniref:hypothetical protein n=1 Tax=Herbaspirillum seropedicae TaxID=964 RepID=UPI00285B8EAA|nr:hypothetical protein [Herbaspirillum seropedicae]MDR6394259.1 hypothetical protein [Herbaspirillum seropedicae]